MTRNSIPKDMPLFLRISATDWLEHLPDTQSWTLEDTIKLAEVIADLGVDLLDVSSGGVRLVLSLLLLDVSYLPRHTQGIQLWRGTQSFTVKMRKGTNPKCLISWIHARRSRPVQATNHPSLKR